MTFFRETIFRFAVFFLTLFYFSPSYSEGTLEKVARTNEFRIGYRNASMPFSYLGKNNKIQGYSIDLCLAIAKKIKEKLHLPDLNIIYTLINSQNRIILLQSGTIDIDCGSTTNMKSRRRQADFSYTIFMAHTKMMVRKGSSIKNFDSIGKRNIVISTGTSSDGVLAKYAKKNHKKLNIIYGKDHANSFLLLVTGRASVFLNDDVLLYTFRARLKNGTNYFVILPDYLRADPYGLMIRKNDFFFKKLVNETLYEIMTSGQIESIYHKWFLSPIPPRGINLMVPLSEDNKKLFLHPNDTSADD